MIQFVLQGSVPMRASISTNKKTEILQITVDFMKCL